MLKKYFSYSPLPFRYFVLTGFVFSLILIASSYLGGETPGDIYYGTLNHSILTFWKYLLWPVFVPGIYLFISSIRGQNTRASKVLFGMLLVLFFAGIHSVISNIFYYLTLWPIIGTEATVVLIEEFFEFFPQILLSRILDVVAIVGLLLGISFFKDYSDNKAQVSLLKAELRGAELEALRNQLKPHFLFNTLNTISSLIDQDTQKAQRVLSKIAHLLRTNLDHSRKEKITLQEELEVVKDYLEIESERFNDRLIVVYKISDDTEKAMVPNLLIQPLVENAIKHGVNKTINLIELKLETNIEQENLVLKITDNGPMHNPKKSSSKNGGVGLSNIKSRLKLLYGEAALLSINYQAGKEFEVMIRIPLEHES